MGDASIMFPPGQINAANNPGFEGLFAGRAAARHCAMAVGRWAEQAARDPGASGYDAVITAGEGAKLVD
jgi:hypothetical protein